MAFLIHRPAITQLQSTAFINNYFHPSFLFGENLYCIQGLPLNCTVMNTVKNRAFVKGL